MSREIKFRAWDGIEVNPKMRPWEDIKEDLGYILSGKNPRWIPMQYTGLKDKNGKEIYEGDILQSKLKHDGHREIWQVIYYPERGCYSYKAKNGTTNSLEHAFSMSRELEVIGNIYENPELLP